MKKTLLATLALFVATTASAIEVTSSVRLFGSEESVDEAPVNSSINVDLFLSDADEGEILWKISDSPNGPWTVVDGTTGIAWTGDNPFTTECGGGICVVFGMEANEVGTWYVKVAWNGQWYDTYVMQFTVTP